MAEKESSKEIERIYVVPLRRAKFGRSSRAAPRAVKQVRGYLTKHMKVNRDDVWIDDSLNRELWSKGKYTIPSKIRVRAVKFEDGIVEVTLPEIGIKKSRREILKEEKEKKTPILRREEAEMPEGGGAAGTDDYEISPTVDGDVKIKKKKAPKDEKPEEKRKAKEKPPKKTENKKSIETKKEKPVKKPTQSKGKRKGSSSAKEKKKASTKQKTSPKKPKK
jgi:large subunit ribosomal protein L31e